MVHLYVIPAKAGMTTIYECISFSLKRFSAALEMTNFSSFLGDYLKFSQIAPEPPKRGGAS
jgi:hypothetical protein